MHKLLNFFRRLKPGSLERETTDAHGQPVDNVDATAAAGFHDRENESGSWGGSNAPPGYVPPADEGRPRH